MAVVVKFKVEVESVGGGFSDGRVNSAAFDEGGSMTNYELADGTTDQAIPISTTTGVTTIQAFYIYSDQTISLRQIAADTAWTVTANRPLIVTGTSMTALLVSNASGSTANIKLAVFGT